ncbi:hypothetical protein POM88_040324 [Heracleum sosnowskyi]|uniref:Uncharacterized protein n=1 Tax=Heracleum sosnowskyi TaxID=360622 RepID=A0AAD8HDW1_9APIA|nr:hypothetical protein POM88_040324 [Heracleum sosnowskyi]
MRAEPKRRNHTIGAKWLRHGDSFPVESSTVETGATGGDGSSVIVGGREHNSMILGDTVGTMNDGGKLAGREIVGSKKDRVVTSAYNQNIISSRVAEREKETTKIENIGLSISDPKRCRTEDEERVGPVDKGSLADIIMIETQNNSATNPKNLILAGSVKETRLLL